MGDAVRVVNLLVLGMPLQSKLFKDDERLQACLVSDPAHVKKGDKGDHVARIQQALRILMEDDGIDIDDAELKSKQYGQSTTDAIQKFKDDRKIINFSYQKSADNIVGKMTIARLDKEMLDNEKANAPEFIDLTRRSPAGRAPVRYAARKFLENTPRHR
jgi:hypothetical protein